jgi:uncharacterized protein (TIGR02231 family)
MKKNSFVIVFLFVAAGVLAQNGKPVDSKIKAVTVFLNKAQVTRDVKTRLDAGKTSIVLNGLTAQMDVESIQAKGKGSFIILGIAHRQNFLSELNLPTHLRILKDSIEQQQRTVQLENSQKEILNKEEQMLVANQKIGGSSQNLTAAELKAMSDFYRARLSDIVITRMKVEDKIKKLNQLIVKLQRQYNEQNDVYSRNTSEIVINVSAETATSADLEVSYVVTNAGWAPVYDLRATNTNSPVQLNYKANVFQGTGEEWKNVKLTLSTANPSQSGLKPELYTWQLDFYQPIAYEYMKQKKSAAPAMMRGAGAEDKEEDVRLEEMPAETIAEYVTAIQTTLNTEFDISVPYTVSSASKPTLVDIRNHEMKASYKYAVTPKLDKDAFLIAKAIGWEEFNLLPGEANIFFEGTYVGKTFVDPNSIKDTLSVSLGRDSRIVVKRERVKDLTTRKLIGANQRETYGYKISVRNTKTESVTIVVEDQVPVSLNSQIEVTAVNFGGAKHNTETGKLTWEFTLKPNESKDMTFNFEVKYPKDKQLPGL